HAMLLLDAERAGDLAKSDELIARLPGFAADVRINVAVRLGKLAHSRFGDALDLVLAEPLPEVTSELLGELGQAILENSPEHVARFVPLLPPDASLLAELAERA